MGSTPPLPLTERIPADLPLVVHPNVGRRLLVYGLAYFAWCLVLLGLAACAGESARTTSNFESSPRRTEPYHKVIVVAVSPDVNVRCPGKAASSTASTVCSAR